MKSVSSQPLPGVERSPLNFPIITLKNPYLDGSSSQVRDLWQPGTIGIGRFTRLTHTMPDEATNPTAPDASTPSVDPSTEAPIEALQVEKSAQAKATPVAEAAPAAKAKAAAKGKATDGAPAEKPKKEKPPALEDKPFGEFITQEFMPKLKTTMGTIGFNDLELTFEKQPLPIRGMEAAGDCWQVAGTFQGGRHSFLIGFLKEDIQGQKVFSCSDYGSKPSLLESFMIDERKVTLDLLLMYTVQRLNGQKWLVGN